MRIETLHEEGATKKRKNNHHKQQQKVPFQKQKQNNRTCENCDQMKLKLSYSKTQQW